MRCMMYEATYENEAGQQINRMLAAYSMTDAVSLATNMYRGINETLVGVKATQIKAPSAQVLAY